jgi:two-component system, NtrC family, sensor histidine kinase HydH
MVAFSHQRPFPTPRSCRYNKAMANEPVCDEQVRRLQAQYAEIAALAGGLAHEIRNPLSTMGLSLKLLEEDLDKAGTADARRMRHRVQIVQQECRNLQRVLDAFLQFVRLGELNRTEADLNAVVRDFVEFYEPQAREHGIDLSPHLAADLPAVRLDTALFRQVLMNLAINAQQAMPGGGQLELQTCARGDRIHLDLIDTGIGADAATVARMFDAFFSRRPGGTGLGLPTVRRIVEAHGGTIACDSEPGRGTRFTIALPSASDALV